MKLFLLSFILLILSINLFFSHDKEITHYYISLHNAGFLPVYNAGIKMNIVLNKIFTYGFGLNSFWTAGSTVNAEIFGKLTLFNTEFYELSISLGIIGGWANEGSFGLKPKQFLGAGFHLQIVPVVIKTGRWGVEFFNMGVSGITDFSLMQLSEKLSDNSGLALSIYLLGVGVRYYF